MKETVNPDSPVASHSNHLLPRSYGLRGFELGGADNPQSSLEGGSRIFIPVM